MPCSVAALVRESDVIVSLCPPDAARDVARQAADAQFAGVYVDANAIAPSTARDVAQIVASGGATYVDGSVIGAPVQPGGWTRLYLSGDGAEPIAALFAADDPTVVVLGDDATAASTLKMCNAAWTKATSAALLTIWATAHSGGVWDALQGEWGRGHADLLTRIEQITAIDPGARVAVRRRDGGDRPDVRGCAAPGRLRAARPPRSTNGSPGSRATRPRRRRRAPALLEPPTR